MRKQQEFFRGGLGLLGLAALAGTVNAQSVFGMTVNTESITETAGANSGSHFCDLGIHFSGGGASGTYHLPTDMPGIFHVIPPPPFRPSGDMDVVTLEWKFYVTSGSGVAGSYPIKYGGSPTAENSAAYTIGDGTTLTFRFPGTTTLGTAFKGLLTCKAVFTHYSHFPLTAVPPYTSAGFTAEYGENYYQSYTKYEEITLDSFRLRRIPVDVASVDSRKTYAPPDKDSVYPAVDANADPRNVGFAGWAFRGGLFVGNANGVNGDQSGISRIQALASPPPGLGNCYYALSLLHIGTPAAFRSASSNWDGALSLQAYVPTGTPTANISVSDLTWATAMDPATSTALGSAINLSAAPSNEYVNLQIGTSMPPRILLKAVDETVPRWRYFGGTTYDQTPSVYPYSECKPHLWACETPTTSSTTATTSTVPPSGAW